MTRRLYWLALLLGALVLIASGATERPRAEDGIAQVTR
jgi:hypothetical protein